MTFKELGTPFPLFEAPVTDASGFRSSAACTICGTHAQVCFHLDIGCAVMTPCPSCGTENGLDTNDRKVTSCRNCSNPIPFPTFRQKAILTCYSCLRAGRAAITKDTELGMVSWEQAFEGLTHGRPGLCNPNFEMVPTDSDWIRARLPEEIMFELLRTPTYNTIQGGVLAILLQKAHDLYRPMGSRRLPPPRA